MAEYCVQLNNVNWYAISGQLIKHPVSHNSLSDGSEKPTSRGQVDNYPVNAPTTGVQRQIVSETKYNIQ